MKNIFENRTEEELLLAFASGDVNALETLLIQKRDWISAVARKIIRDPHLAEDAVQEALVRIFKNAGSFKGESKASTWLYRVITNSCIDLLRKVEKYSTESNIDFINIEGYSVEEAAKIMEISPGTVKSRCARGRTILAKILIEKNTKNGNQ